ncbi:unnamed protein product [Kuraishia capsulata CBS 1993]|uniref:MOSC domain-containing protein n=1 Tax=Kuraishia capsulata CBS 1993 TaxID=1382522 RepID=W6MLJ6_9ASCO|nr:uncharacterized protein KUCA_T00003339001 [Kuraishia capsulata CBS 1993]CDK27361.1 unnamed protein product [Kuraishia capsulata CBS 1993]
MNNYAVVFSGALTLGASCFLAFPRLLGLFTGYIDEREFFTNQNTKTIKLLRAIVNASYATKSYLYRTLNPEYHESQIPTISKIIIYPIKSCGPGVQVKEWQVDEHGLKHDRQYALAQLNEEAGLYTIVSQKFVSTRLTLLKCAYFPEQNCFEYKYPLKKENEMDSFRIPAEITEEFIAENINLSEPLQMSIWTNGIQCYDVSHCIPSKFFEEMDLPSGTRLVLSLKGKEFKDTSPPKSTFYQDPSTNHGKEYRRTHFQDYFPIHIVTEEDMSDLNFRIKKKGFNLNREIIDTAFRPNLLLSGTARPYDVDTWNRFDIEDHTTSEKHSFTRNSKCMRCLIPDINPVTGVSDKEFPVSKTLMSYRRVDSGAAKLACFGNYCVQDVSNFQIHVGDRIHILSRKITVTKWSGGGLVHH